MDIAYRKLSEAILLRAFDDLRKPPLRADALSFLFDPEGEEDLSFWCAVFGVQPDKVRRKAEQILEEVAA